VPNRTRRFALVIAGVVLLIGVGAFVAARHAGFASPPDRSLRKAVDLNRLGSVVVAAIGGLALAGAAIRVRALVITAGVVALAAAVLVLVQTGHAPNWLGGRGNTFALFVACALAFVSIPLVTAKDG
jgi:hypothetical protein